MNSTGNSEVIVGKEISAGQKSGLRQGITAKLPKSPGNAPAYRMPAVNIGVSKCLTQFFFQHPLRILPVPSAISTVINNGQPQSLMN